MLLLFLVPPRRSPPATAELLQESFRACVSSGRKIAQWTLSVPVEPSQCKASRDCALTVPKVRELTVPKNREFTKIEIYLGILAISMEKHIQKEVEHLFIVYWVASDNSTWINGKF